jgi:hypothetical protein
MFGGEINIANGNWVIIMDNSLISSLPIVDMGEQASKNMHRFWSNKR